MPSLWAAEVAWRWSFALAAAVLLLLSAYEFLRTLPASGPALLLIRSHNAFLVAQAMANILHGSGPRLLRLAAILLPAVALLWTVFSAVGRAATLRALAPARSVRLRPLLGLSFLRAALLLAAALACCGALALVRIGGSAIPDSAPASGVFSVALIMAFALTAAILLAWSFLNWLLAFAAVCVATAETDTLGAALQAVQFLRLNPRSILVASTWFGLLHVVTLGGAMSVAGSAMALAPASGTVAAAGVLLSAAAYFAAVDLLHIARLAAYLRIAEAKTEMLPEEAGAPAVSC